MYHGCLGATIFDNSQAKYHATVVNVFRQELKVTLDNGIFLTVLIKGFHSKVD